MANRLLQGLFSQRLFSQRQSYEQKYKTSRMNLLLVVLFTAINLLLLVTNTDVYFLFSAFIPYYIAFIGMFLGGRFPAENYVDWPEEMFFLDDSFFAATLVISIILTLLYLLAWFMSRKNRVGWLIFTLVFFGLDTLGMLLISGIYFESVFDILFHAWVIYYLVLGISAHYKLKKLAPEEAVVSCENVSRCIDEGSDDNSDPIVEQTRDSYIIRVADKDVKHRVLLETNVLNYNICYRRVKHTNELVINGNVYDELEGVIECPHMLKAWIDGHYIAAGYNGMHSFISVDGENAAKKIRLF